MQSLSIGRVSAEIRRPVEPLTRLHVLEALAVLSGNLPGKVTAENCKTWCFEILDRSRRGASFSPGDVMKGCRTLASQGGHVDLSTLLRAIRHAKAGSVRDESSEFVKWRRRYEEEGHSTLKACKHAKEPGEVCERCRRGKE